MLVLPGASAIRNIQSLHLPLSPPTLEHIDGDGGDGNVGFEMGTLPLEDVTLLCPAARRAEQGDAPNIVYNAEQGS